MKVFEVNFKLNYLKCSGKLLKVLDRFLLSFRTVTSLVLQGRFVLVSIQNIYKVIL